MPDPTKSANEDLVDEYIATNAGGGGPATATGAEGGGGHDRRLEEAILLARRDIERAETLDDLDQALREHDIELLKDSDGSGELVARIRGVAVPAARIAPELATEDLYQRLRRRLHASNQQYAQGYEQGLYTQAPLRTALAALAWRGGRWLTRNLHPGGTPEQRADRHRRAFEDNCARAEAMIEQIHRDPVIASYQRKYERALGAGDDAQAAQCRERIATLLGQDPVDWTDNTFGEGLTRETLELVPALNAELDETENAAHRWIDILHRHSEAFGPEAVDSARERIHTRLGILEAKTEQSVVPTDAQGAQTLGERIAEMARAITRTFEDLVERVHARLTGTADTTSHMQG